MGANHDRKDCEGRTRRHWQPVELDLRQEADAASLRQPLREHGAEVSDEGFDEGAPSAPSAQARRITAVIYRDGRLWQASAKIEGEGDHPHDWWRTAIAALDTSVDMAVADEA